MALETALKYLTGMTDNMTAEELVTAAHIAQAWIALAGALRTTPVTPKTPRENPPRGPITVDILGGSPFQRFGDELGVYAAGVAKGRELAARAVSRTFHERVGSDNDALSQQLVDLLTQAAESG